MNIYGYCRISTAKQSIDRQIRNIRAEYPTAHIVQEAYTGTSIFRPEWLKLYRILKFGDMVVFDSVSRMSRNAEEGFALYEDLYHKGIRLVFLKEHHIDTETYKKALSGSIAMTGTNVDFILKGINEYLMALAKEQIKLAVPAKRESPRLKVSSGNGSITRMSGIRRKPWLLRMPIPDPHTGITVVKTVGTYVTREEAEAVRAEMMKRPATPYQDSTLAKIHEVFLESREYKRRSDKARELYDLAWKYLKPLWYYKIAALYAQDFQNILDKMADDGLSQSMLEKERTLISKLYRTAIGWRVVDANLASVLKIEGRKSPEREIFTDEQVTLILSQKNTPTGQMVIALLACGVRIYELLHFKHEDFHRTESGAYLIGGCKTEAGRNRIIPILDFGIPVFEHAYATSVENGPLFPNGKGGFWNEKNWRNRKFYPFLEEIGIQPNPYDENGKRKPEFAGKLATYTPYTTRHTYASLCDRAGVNKDILKRAVGHTPKSKTLDEVYLHPKATQMIEAFDKANQLVKDEVLALPEE